MKISLQWLNDYIELKLSAEQIAEILSDLGFPSAGIEHMPDDAVLDVEITSNRGDCLSYIGIARELSVVTGKSLKLPKVELTESTKRASEFASVEVHEQDLCPRYTARIIEGVKVGPSPDWLRKRLETMGMRSVNNVVDATNYAMFETGQPPHAFDYEKIAGKKIIVRKARPGERLVSIDGTKCELDPNMLIIADARQPVAIAGVMGGLDTEVSENTKNILLEDAYFDPVCVRTTSRKLALPSESSFRFERIVDIDMVDLASKRTAQLITQLAGGKVAAGVIDIYPKKSSAKQVTLRLSRLQKLLGIEVPANEVFRILTGLNFNPQQKDGDVFCSVPSWRSDVYREADLIEEVARVYGYNKVPTRKKISIQVVPVDTRQKQIETVGTFLNSCGFYEAVTTGFVDSSVAQLFVTPDAAEHLVVKDVSRKQANWLRRSLLPSLLGVLKTNLNAKNTPCEIFEIAATFAPAKAGQLPVERTMLTLVSDGQLRGMTGAIKGLIKSISKDAEVAFAPAQLVWAQAGAQILVNGSSIGQAGVVSKKVTDKFDFKTAPVAAELDFEQLLALRGEQVKMKPIPKFPAVERDLSLVLDETVLWVDVLQAVKSKATGRLEDVRFVEIYRGKGIPTGEKGLTLSLRFRDIDGTLTHEAVDKMQAEIVASLAQSVGAQLRTL